MRNSSYKNEGGRKISRWFIFNIVSSICALAYGLGFTKMSYISACLTNCTLYELLPIVFLFVGVFGLIYTPIVLPFYKSEN